MTIALVLVSHVAAIAAGVRDLAAQMAADVPIYVAGGSDEDGVGTSFAKIEAALGEAIQHDGVVVLYDLGSALLTAEMAVEMLSQEYAERTRIVSAPLVEGAVAAAVAAQQERGLDAVADAARSALAPEPGDDVAAGPPAGATRRTTVLRNDLGLHARPAADLARVVAERDASMWVGRDGGDPREVSGVVGVIALALRGGETVTLWADGPEADAALEEVERQIEAGFGELDEVGRWEGAGVAAGTATGPAAVVHLAGPEPAGPVESAEEEERVLRTAVSAVEDELRAATGAFAPIAAAHAVLLNDPMLADAAGRAIAQGSGAATAWWTAVRGAAEMLAGLPDPGMADRAADVWDLGHRVLALLQPDAAGAVVADAQGRIVVCEHPLPSRIADWVAAGAVGLATVRGGATSHGAQLAAALGIPMVSGLPPAVLAIADGAEATIDGSAGTFGVDQPEHR